MPRLLWRASTIQELQHSKRVLVREAQSAPGLGTWNHENPDGEKPKWMRWRTFDRLVEQHGQLVGRSMNALVAKLGLLERGAMK